MRNLIVDMFEGIAWVVFVAIIALYTYGGYQMAKMGRLPVEPFMGGGIGFVIGLVISFVITGLIFTFLDMRSSLDRLVELAEKDRGEG